MFSLSHATKWHRIRLLASTSLLPLALVSVSPASAQQSASPDLLPSVSIAAPTPPKVVQSAETDKPSRAARKKREPKPVVAAAPAPGTPAGPVVPTVVSPTGIVTPASQVPNSVTVITAQDILTQQYRTIPDAMNTVPGLNVIQSGGPGGQSSIFIRGTNSNHTKVLVDGIDIGDPTTPNAAYDFAHLLTGDISQVEVLRGPQSGLYGSDAIGGVISIITQKGEGPARATASVEGGSFGTLNQTVGISGSKDNFNYAVSLDHLHVEDLPVTPQAILPPGQKANGNSYDNRTFSEKTGLDLSEYVTVNSVVRYTEGLFHFTGDNFNNPPFTGQPNVLQSTQENRQFFTREEAVVSLWDGRIKNYFGVNYANLWSSSVGPGDATPTVFTGTRLKYDWHAVTELAAGQNLVVGAEKQTETLDTTGFSAQTGNKAVFVELQNQFADRFFLVSNFRDDFNDSFGEHSTYRIAPAVILPFTETKLKASYGTGFKAPSLSQLYQSFPDFFFFANPNLRPETSIGYDAGFEQPLFNDRVRFGSTYFHNDITNLINTITDPTTFNTTYTNVGRATTEGTENFVLFNVTNNFNIRGDYTFTRAVDNSTGIQLLRRPKEKWSTTATWKPTDPWTLSATVLHVSSWIDTPRDMAGSNVYAPGYTIVNFRTDYALNDQWKVFGRVDNVFNTHYQNPLGFMAPGLGVFGGVRFASYGVK